MKNPLIVLLTLTGVCSTVTPALCQVPELAPTQGQTQSESLSIAPLERSRSPHAGQNAASLQANQLSAIANSIHVGPNSGSAANSGIGSMIPKDLFRTPSQLLPDSHPLEVFQPPAPNRSFGVNLSGF